MKPVFFISTFLFLLSFLFPNQTTGQITFGYDANGNRTSRATLFLKNSDALNADSTKQIFNLMNDVKVIISPNPTKGHLKIKIENLDEGVKPELYLHSVKGEQLYKNEYISNINEVDLSQYQDGVYFLSLIISGEKETWKVIKQ